MSRPSRRSAESELGNQVYLAGLPEPRMQYRFHPTRKWLMDLAFPEYKIAAEIEGGAFKKGGGRHNRGPGFRNDMRKYNAAQALGWRVFRFLPEMVESGEALSVLEEVLGG